MIFNWSLNPFIISTKLLILNLESSRIPSRWTRQIYWRFGLLFTLETISTRPLITSEARDLLAVVASSKMNLYCSALDVNIQFPSFWAVPCLTPISNVKNKLRYVIIDEKWWTLTFSFLHLTGDFLLIHISNMVSFESSFIAICEVAAIHGNSVHVFEATWSSCSTGITWWNAWMRHFLIVLI